MRGKTINMKQKSLNYLQILACLFYPLIYQGCKGTVIKPSKKEFETVFEKSGGKKTATYEEGMAFWKKLDSAFKELSIVEFGETDAGFPLHLIYLSENGDTIVSSLEERKKNVILINNAIHPGEPDGVDASMMLLRDILYNDSLKALLKDNIITCIPFYNIGGARNRNTNSRANQNGPEEYGFRGNAQNLDLNRDFVKCDSKNARSFVQLFQKTDPDLYIETHVSNGADYQYTMTCLPTLHQKLDAPLGDYFKANWMDRMYDRMKDAGEEMCPYVNIFNQLPDSGMAAFIDYPRYSTGYAALFQTPGFITETLMLKPYKERVWATYHFLMEGLRQSSEDAGKLRQFRIHARIALSKKPLLFLDWEIRTDTACLLPFKGYKTVIKPSEVTGKDRMYFDEKEKSNIIIPYCTEANGLQPAKIPEYYILSAGWWRVKELLKFNFVNYRELINDTKMLVTVTIIDTFNTVEFPYESHYWHSRTKTLTEKRMVRIPKGSWIISTNQKARRFLTEVFEPVTPDSYFNWNFFDAVIQQKEWYSDYVFEDKASKILRDNITLKKTFEEKKNNDPVFREDARAQLYFIYKNSEHYESGHRVLPVYRIE
jgi:hypothetical protein